VILFNPRIVDDACVWAQYLENIRPKEGETKWFEEERALGIFQGGEEEVERGKI
jgi:hypothetical protein